VHQLHLLTETSGSAAIEDALGRIEGVHRLVAVPGDGGRTLIRADLDTETTDHVVVLLDGLGVAHADYVIARLAVVAPAEHRGSRRKDEGFAWAEVLGEARASARPLARYVAFMAAAGVIACYGVLDSSEVLIVGAMAVAPDLMPICATAVGIVGRRPRLVGQALLTVAIGMALVAGVAAVLSSVLEFMDRTPEHLALGEGVLGGLSTVDDATVIVALAAGVAAMMAFETRASAAVGVAISVTTIPASALLGVAIGVGHSDIALDALAVLCANIACLILAGSITLAVRRAAAPYW
jgi:uncharacterized hydrophobic protein (TIGR00271 family)